MYGMSCGKGVHNCNAANCLHPEICPNLDASHAPLLRLMKAARRVKGVRHVFISSGIRFDLALRGGGDEYIRELADHHVGGLLKIAPEHVSDSVLRRMRKPCVKTYRMFVNSFLRRAREAGRKHAIVEYFMSGHPGCALDDMVELACYLHKMNIKPEQTQDFYPAPITMATAMYYTGMDPDSMTPVYVARTDRDKSLQRALLLCHKREFHSKARQALIEAGHPELIGRGKNCLVPPAEGGA
jgi:uncharacterized radical SAM protein YgiQ